MSNDKNAQHLLHGGLIGGRPVGRSGPLMRDDGIYREVRVVPNVYERKVCNLTFSGLDELMAANFPHEINTLEEQDVLEHFAIDPMEHIDLDEIRREFGQESYFDEYMYE